MRLIIASDHAGFELKTQIIALLHGTEQIADLGPTTKDSVDYPDFADKVCLELKADTSDTPILGELGILICGSGQGMALRANKYHHIRAALVYNSEIATLAREHNNANILCVGSRFASLEQVLEWIEIFKKTPFAGGRHQTRVAKVSAVIS